MKNYITIAALLAAGTACANAATLVSFNTKSDLSLVDNLNTDYGFSFDGLTDKVTIVPEVTEPAKATFTDGTSASNKEYLRPNTNVGLGGEWELTFTITNNGIAEATIDSITFDAFAFGATGQVQTQARDAKFTLNNTEQTFNHSANAGGSVTFNFSEALALAVNDSMDFTLTVSQQTASGTFIGLKNISISGTGTVVPEPSAFGLLAGIGALALVASRRRRK